MQLTPFHVALQVRNLSEAREFYAGRLGLPEGRSAETWIDFNMFGHQFVVHLNAALGDSGQLPRIDNVVDSHGVPVPHCGVVLQFASWSQLAARLRSQQFEFIIEPTIRFKGEVGEQGTLFFADPSGNVLEFKGFRDIEAELFAR